MTAEQDPSDDKSAKAKGKAQEKSAPKQAPVSLPDSKHKPVYLKWSKDKGALNPKAQKRLVRELQEIKEEWAHEFKTEVKDAEKNIWHVSFKVDTGKFKGKVYTIQMRFRSDYPVGAPECFFVGKYPNMQYVMGGGFICLSTFWHDWTPIMKASSTAMSIKSLVSTVDKNDYGSGDGNDGGNLGSSPKDF